MITIPTDEQKKDEEGWVRTKYLHEDILQVTGFDNKRHKLYCYSIVAKPVVYFSDETYKNK